MTSHLLRLHQEKGALVGEVAGSPIVMRYGEIAHEYQSVRDAVGIVDRADLAQIRMWGRDPVRMLQGLVTNDVAGARLGQGVYGAMLTPKGKMIAELRIFRRHVQGGTELLLSLPREAVEGTIAHLRKFVPPMFAKWSDATEETGVVGVYGPRSAELLEGLLGGQRLELDEDSFVELQAPGAEGGDAPLLIAGTRYAGGEIGFDIFTSSRTMLELWSSLLEHNASPVGFEALEVLRIEAGRPRYGSELTEDTIPTEAYQSTGMMERAISFSKGCYTGQEVIVRIAHRGHVNRLLRGLLLGDAAAPAAGTPLLRPDDGKVVGQVTSACHSPLHQQTIALGYVRRELDAGESVRIGAADGKTAVISKLPFELEPSGAGA